MTEASTHYQPEAPIIIDTALNAATFQRRTFDWIKACFGGDMSARAINVRKHRFLEEALELVQALDTTKAEALQLVDYVYGRPKGEVRNEIGGTGLTLASLCESIGQNMNACFEEELARVNQPGMIEKIRAKNAAKPAFSPLPVDPANDADNRQREFYEGRL